MHPRTIIAALALSTTLLAGACGADESEPTTSTETTIETTTIESRHVLTGEVVIRGADELSHLPDGAQLRVRLNDVSLMDAPSVTIAEMTWTPATLPATYELRWDVDLDPRLDYSVSARVESADGDLLFISDTTHRYEPGGTGVTVELISV